MEVSLVSVLLAAALRAGTPILLAALGELLAERAGVLNLDVEGMMLVGALAGFMASQQTGEPWVGLLAAAKRWRELRFGVADACEGTSR